MKAWSQWSLEYSHVTDKTSRQYANIVGGLLLISMQDPLDGGILAEYVVGVVDIIGQ